MVVTDTTWRLTTDGPIVANNEFDGEEYDASKELGKWSEAGYDDSAWMNARSVGAPEGALHAQRNPNIRVMEDDRSGGDQPAERLDLYSSIWDRIWWVG